MTLWTTPPALSGLRETLDPKDTNGPHPELQLHMGRGLADSERTRRLMPTLGDPADAAHADAMSHLDGCPTACGDTALPHSAEPAENGYRCDYRCSCGEAWFTTWRVGD